MRHGEKPLRQDGESDDGEGIRLDGGQLLRQVRLPWGCWLQDRQPEGLGSDLDGRRAKPTSASGGAVGIGDDSGHLVPTGGEPLQRGHGEGGRAKENDAHR